MIRLEDVQLNGLKASYTFHNLQFKQPSGTSRGVLTDKPVWYIVIESIEGTKGIGECSPIFGLSMEKRVIQIMRKITSFYFIITFISFVPFSFFLFICSKNINAEIGKC